MDILYDAAGRKVRETLSGGGAVHTVTQLSYDADNRLACTAVRMNPAAFASLPASACDLGAEGAFGPDRITRNLHDAAGQLLQVREGVGTADEAAEATYAYTGNGKRRFVIDGRGNRAELRYDGHDRQARWVFPSATGPSAFNDASPAFALASAGAVNEGDYEEYGYDPAGNRTRLRRRGGQEIGFSYDALGRMTGKDLPGAEPDTAFTYDLRGLQLSAAFAGTSEAVTNGFDKAGRLTSTTTTMGGVSRTVASGYDANGNRILLTYPSGRQLAYDHDGLGRVAAIRNAGGPALVAYGYDAQGRRASITRGGGANSAYGYDGAGRLATLSEDTADNQAETVVSFSYNPAGQIVTRTGTSDAYAYNAPIPNGTTSYAADGLNRYASITGGAPAYDLNGNMTSDGTLGFSYSSENMLVNTTFPPKWSGHTSMSLRYDPLLRLHETNGTALTHYLYDGTDLIAEYEAGVLTHEYVHGPGADEPVMDYYFNAGTGYPHWLHPDERGSIHLVTRPGNTFGTNTLDEYGNFGWYNWGRFQFTGQTWLPDIFLHNYKARVYHPGAKGGGRFLQTDPTGYEDQMNMYAYPRNDPVNAIDPTGTHCGTRINTSQGSICSNDALGTQGSIVGVTSRAARVGMQSARARAQYGRQVARLSSSDSKGRSDAKLAIRRATPREIRAIIEARRGDTGPKPGSGGRANVTNPSVDRGARVLGIVGRGSLAVTIGIAAHDVANSSDRARSVFANVGAVLGGVAGGAGGAFVGAFGGPVAPITAPAGGIAGAIAGGNVGYSFGEDIYDILYDD